LLDGFDEYLDQQITARNYDVVFLKIIDEHEQKSYQKPKQSEMENIYTVTTKKEKYSGI
jgi:hypothetical protein